jgi:PAS domain S-box-containing protein
MRDIEKTECDLIEELNELREQVSHLENSEALLKKAKASLKEEAIRRRMLVEQSTDGIVVLTVDGKVYEANQKFADMLRYTLEEAHQLYLWDWDKNHSKEALLKMAEVIDETGDHFISRHSRKDGTVFDVDISSNGTVCDGKKLIFCVCRDISERKRYEEQLRESKEQLSAFVDNFRGIAYQIGVNSDNIQSFKPLFFRGAVKQITGYSNNEFTEAHSWNDLIHPQDIQKVSLMRNNFLLDTNFVAEMEYRIICRDKSVRWVQDIAQIINIRNENVIHGTIFDITEKKTTEEANIKLEECIRQSQKLEAVGTLAGGIAHDFNNTLSIIMGYTDLALSEIPPDSNTSNKLFQVKIASMRARDTVKQLLTFSRKVGPKKFPVNIVSIIEEAVSFLHSTLPANIQIEFKSLEDSLMILADPTQINQVMTNLCINASQALETTGGVIKLTSEKILHKPDFTIPFKDIPDGMYVKVTVSDSGVGIPENIIGRIFEPYFTTRKTGKGSGMGLAVVHGIIGNHGGAITVVSEPQKGSSFTFIMPVFDKKIPFVKPPSTIIPSGVESILFVDDEEEIVKIMKLILEKQGFRVITSTDPRIALDIFKNSPKEFDIVVTDMTMPHLTGDRLFKNIKKIKPEIPVILCTGHSSLIDEQKALDMGFAAYFLKPLSRHEFIEKIRLVLDKKA